MNTLAGSISTTVSLFVSKRVLVIPLGSTEQHGPHLPLDTDTQITLALVDTLSQRKPDDVSVGPTIPLGSSGEHLGFAGTLSLTHQTLGGLIRDIVHSASGWRAVYFVSAHGGNALVVLPVVHELRQHGFRVDAWFPTQATFQNAAHRWEVDGDARGLYDPDLHAGRTETSIMLALNPEAVRLDLARVGQTERSTRVVELLQTQGVHAVSTNGVLGDPSGASYEEGCLLLGAMADELVDHFEGFAGRAIA